MRKFVWIILVLVGALSAPAQSMWYSSTFNASTAAATPTFSPAAGVVTNPTTVTLSTSTAGCGAYIYWNTAGNPTASDTHGTSVSVAAAETVYAKVIACPGYGDSTVGTAAYTLTGLSDAFVGTSGTVLSTHDANWVEYNQYSNPSSCQLTGSGGTTVITTGGSCGGLYNTSSSLTTQINIPAGQASTVKYYLYLDGTVHVDATFSGYYTVLTSSNGTSWNQASLYRSGSVVNTGGGGTFLLSSPHVFRMTRAGSLITATVDGTIVSTYTDGSPVTGGLPGFAVNENGAGGPAIVTGWQDY